MRDQSEGPVRTGEAQLADGPRLRPEPLTDAEHAERVRNVRAWLADARSRGLVMFERFFDLAGNRWTTERQLMHRDLVDDLYMSASDVPCEREAIMAGSAGAGKSTVLDEHADVGRSRYLAINPGRHQGGDGGARADPGA